MIERTGVFVEFYSSGWIIQQALGQPDPFIAPDESYVVF